VLSKLYLLEGEIDCKELPLAHRDGGMIDGSTKLAVTRPFCRSELYLAGGLGLERELEMDSTSLR